MREQGIAYNVAFAVPWLEEKLRCKADSIEFGTAISCINDEIIEQGYYLSARDTGGREYRILPPSNTEDVADARVRRSFREMSRAMKLFGGIARNETANLDAEAKRRLESKEEKAAVRLVLMRRPVAIAGAVSKHSPKLLNP